MWIWRQAKNAKKHTLRRVFLHTFILQIHTFLVCKNTHLFRKIHTFTCVKKHALRCASVVSIGRIFQLFGFFNSSVCFGAKRERSVSCDTDLSSTNQNAPFTLWTWDYGPEKIKTSSFKRKLKKISDWKQLVHVNVNKSFIYKEQNKFWKKTMFLITMRGPLNTSLWLPEVFSPLPFL